MTYWAAFAAKNPHWQIWQRSFSRVSHTIVNFNLAYVWFFLYHHSFNPSQHPGAGGLRAARPGPAAAASLHPVLRDPGGLHDQAAADPRPGRQGVTGGCQRVRVGQGE